MALSREEIARLRQEYARETLSENTVNPDPFQQFDLWFREALSAEVPEPNALSLATAPKNGIPTIRIVLLKDFDERGFSFFTNYNSRKAKDLEENPNAAMNFLWLPIERQIRIEGKVEKVSNSESDIYFAIRPRGSQVGAWASPQSSFASLEELQKNVEEFDKKFEGQEVPRPPHWGGYRLKPNYIEFWQGRPNRMHDRILYLKEGNEWKIKRMAP